MLITTTDFIPNAKITQINGIVFSEKVISINAVKDMSNYIKGIFGGQFDSYAEEYTKARTLALEHLENQAKALNSNAIINVNVQFDQFINSDIIFIIAAANGVAVTTQTTAD